MKVPTKIESGSIWITEDTPVVKKGETVSAKMASLLSKLGMKPVEAGVDLYVAYEGGLIYPQELLRINLQEVMANLQKAALEAFNLALNAAYPTPETLPTLLGRAALESTVLAVAGVDFGKETMPLLLSKGYGEMSALLDRLKAKDTTLAS
jgi:large subunit ribosomal protein L10